MKPFLPCVMCCTRFALQVVISAHGQLDSCWLDAPRSAAAAALLVKLGNSSSRARQQQAAAGNSTTSSSNSSLQAGVQPLNQAASKAVQEGVAAGAAAAAATAAAVTTVSAGKPCRVPGTGLQAAGCSSCGWVFDQGDMFDQVLLLQLLQLVQPCVMRLKGVFRVGQKQWVMPLSLAAPLQQQQRDAQLKAEQDKQQQIAAAPAAGDTAACKKQLQLQPVCYRGPSMVEVIVSAPGVITAEAAGAAGSAADQLHTMITAFVQQQQDQQLSDAAVSGSESSRADGAGLAEAGIDNLALSSASSLQMDSTWQLLEEAMLACLQRI
jgi:hypothetical protein